MIPDKIPKNIFVGCLVESSVVGQHRVALSNTASFLDASVMTWCCLNLGTEFKVTLLMLCTGRSVIRLLVQLEFQWSAFSYKFSIAVISLCPGKDLLFDSLVVAG